MYVYILRYTDICTLYIRVPQESQVSVKCLSDKKNSLKKRVKIDSMYIKYKDTTPAYVCIQ